MKRPLAALTLSCTLVLTSATALAGSTSPDMGPPPSQTGMDPRTQGSDVERQGTDMDKGNPATGIRRGMSNGVGGSNNVELPGGDSSGSGSTGNVLKSPSGTSPKPSGAGG